MTERNVTGPMKVELAIPQGIYIGAVMMNRDTFELVDISGRRPENRVVCQTPKGNWKVMAFYLTEGKSRVVDYLDERAMDAFISLTYEKYQANLRRYFGNLIKETFYDEPALHHADRMWTRTFNVTFQKLHGYSPMKHYPALWYDIGPQTAATRNALWGHRAELFATNFIKRLNDWCAARGLQFGGHLDQEEPVNPVPITGDLLKVFEHQALPTVDERSRRRNRPPSSRISFTIQPGGDTGWHTSPRTGVGGRDSGRREAVQVRFLFHGTREPSSQGGKRDE